MSPSFTNTYSLAFDGVDDRVELSSNFVASTEFTISFWMKPSTISGNGSPYVIGRFPLLFNNYIKLDQLGVIWILIDQTLVKFLEGTYGGGANNIVLNEWQNIIITRDSSNGLRCYRNGAAYGYSGTPITNSSTLTLNSIGRNYSNTYGFQGSLDEISFWNSDETANISTISTSPVVDLTSLNPVAWYRMGDNGTWKSPQWLIPNNENKTKFSNYSFEYDGVDDKITFSDITSSGDFTVSFWAKPTAFNINGSSFVFGTESNNSNFFKFVSATSIQMKIVVASTFIDTTGSNNVVLNQWQNIIITRDNSGNFKMYRNGVQFGSTLTNANTLTINSIGRVISSSFGYAGSVDEFAYWNSVQEVATIYNSGVPTDISSLSPVGYWRSENSTFSTNWTVTDNGSGSNDGTSANMTIEDRVGDASNSTSNALSLNMDEADRVEDVPS